MSADVLGIPFDALTLDEAVERALALLDSGRATYVCTPNPEMVWAARKDGALRAAIADADMILPDGVGIVWAARTLGRPVPERVAGYDFLLALLGRLRGRVYLLGGKPGVAERAASAITERYPAVTVAGLHDGYFTEDGPVLADIAAAAPALVLVCLGMGRQEKWMAAHRDALPPCLLAGLGGSLDVLAGDTPRAPERWRAHGLEWLYRLLRQPGRLRRQLCLPLFVLAVLGQKIKEGLRGAPG